MINSQSTHSRHSKFKKQTPEQEADQGKGGVDVNYDL